MIVFQIEIDNPMTVTMFLCDVGIAAHYHIPRGHVKWSLPPSIGQNFGIERNILSQAIHTCNMKATSLLVKSNV